MKKVRLGKPQLLRGKNLSGNLVILKWFGLFAWFGLLLLLLFFFLQEIYILLDQKNECAP